MLPINTFREARSTYPVAVRVLPATAPDETPNPEDGVKLSGATAPAAPPAHTPCQQHPLQAPPTETAPATLLMEGAAADFSLDTLIPERAAFLRQHPAHTETVCNLPPVLRWACEPDLSAIHTKEDGYTEQHMQRASQYANQLANALDGTGYALTVAEKSALQASGALYDVGKLVVDDKVLMNPGKPSDEDRKAINRHVLVRTNRFPEGGDPEVERLFGATAGTQGVREIVRHHHERWDGKGYPDQLKGHDIPLTAQIMGVADMWDSITTRRPWREAKDIGAAREMMTEMAQKGQFNPELVSLFLAKVVDGPATNC